MSRQRGRERSGTCAQRRLLLLVAVGLVAIAGSATAVFATPPGSNGRIAFMRNDAGVWQVWAANPDLSGAVQITSGDTNSGFAQWSPDGSRLAFHSERTDPAIDDDDPIADVFTMRADGSDVRKVTDSVGYNQTPTWSPDGTLIAFTRFLASAPQEQGVFVIRPDGTGLRRVTRIPAGASFHDAPRFSPDGTKLVFTEIRGGTVQKNRFEGRLVGERSALFVVNLDGSGLQRVSPWGARTGDADWSPDGGKLVFETVFEHAGNGPSIMVVNADGSNPKALTRDNGLTGAGSSQAFRFEASGDPVWSPDGTLIMFTHVVIDPVNGYTAGLQTIRPDGSGQAYVSPVLGDEHQVDWGTAPLSP